ncbi:crossover junction endodeoxyribonuclease RuvC [Patescibacteria group bacterium]|nr:crossover junction endodeoxyribonuclease RuvC [Patescibacteria group bacterium]
MIILGIDPGYGRLGYAVLEKNDKENLIDCGCLETTSKEEHSDRILKIADGVEKIIKKYKPEILAIEKIYFTTNQKTALKVSEIKGIITYLALKNKMRLAEYTPLEVKIAVCGYGRAPKEQIKKMVDLLIKVKNPPKNDDTYDAIALCLTCSATLPCR